MTGWNALVSLHMLVVRVFCPVWYGNVSLHKSWGMELSVADQSGLLERSKGGKVDRTLLEILHFDQVTD